MTCRHHFDPDQGRECSLEILRWIEFAVLFVAKMRVDMDYDPESTPFVVVTSRLARIGEITSWEQSQLNAIHRETEAVRQSATEVSKDRLLTMLNFCDRFAAVYNEDV